MNKSVVEYNAQIREFVEETVKKFEQQFGLTDEAENLLAEYLDAYLRVKSEQGLL